VRMSVEITYRGDAEVMKKELGPIVNAALAQAIEEWHERTLPRHFQPSAAGRYHYKARTVAWKKHKRKKVGHDNPLVYTGDLKREVTRMIEIKTLKTKPSATGKMRGPRYLHMTPSANYRHNYAAELLAMTRAETAAMARHVDQIVTKALNNLKETRTVRVA